MKLLKYLPCIFLFLSCAGNNGDVNIGAIDSSKIANTATVILAHPDSSYEIVSENAYYIWEVNMEKRTLKKNPALGSSNANVDSVINGLNMQYENILLEKTGIKKDTLQLKIESSDFLTNQMGSSGPDQYLAQAVINLTSVPGIKYVQIDFKEGSHASPGVWSRKDFPGYIIIQ